jgi:hypothetical protein
MIAGYSGTPLAKKLGLKPGMRAWFHAMPEGVRAEIASEVEVAEQAAPAAAIEAAHIFVTERSELERLLVELQPLITPSGFLWVSWPKKAAKAPTDIVEDVIRDVALPMGLVDIKVCAVDATWSGLKLVTRRENR